MNCSILRLVVAVLSLVTAVPFSNGALFSYGPGHLQRTGERATLDYYVFALDQPATIVATASWLFGHRTLFNFFEALDPATLGADIPNIGFAIGPLPIGPTTRSQMFDLAPGLYAAVVEVPESEWDPVAGYPLVPFFDSNGIDFPDSGYMFSLEGDFRMVRMLEGNFDGTFTETVVPEPASLGMLAVGMVLAFRRGQRQPTVVLRTSSCGIT